MFRVFRDSSRKKETGIDAFQDCERIIEYVHSLITLPELVGHEMKRLRKIRTLSLPEREIEYVKIYLLLEKFITTREPLKKYSVKTLREHVSCLLYTSPSPRD